MVTPPPLVTSERFFEIKREQTKLDDIITQVLNKFLYHDFCDYKIAQIFMKPNMIEWIRII